MATEAMATKNQPLTNTANTDIAMGLAVVVIVLMMVIPLSPIILDLLLSLNITFSLILLLVGMYILKPLEFSSFPSVLLVATLFRLSLNISTTRVILLHGAEGPQAAGKVIQSFGNFVVGGNYLVGIIVFLILVVINFLVITKGAGRIAEVAARFTLDAMPGKQMSIDADLNAGLIDENEAKTRRIEISREAEYYGAMDGANKFVRGDAVAGIIITFVNIMAGLAIGILQHKMALLDALQTFTLLTVGDGLVSQIPALLISTSAGIIVSRAGAEVSLGSGIISQVAAQPRAIAMAGGVLFGFSLIPGLPTIPFMMLGTIAGALSYALFTTVGEKKAATPGEIEMEEKPEIIDPMTMLKPVDTLSMEVGYGLIPMVDSEQNGELLERIRAIRREIAREIGILVPAVHIQDNIQLKPAEYVIFLRGNEIVRGTLMLDKWLAMKPDAGVSEAERIDLDGISTKEPTYGLPALWISESSREKAIADGYTVVDLSTVLTTHLSRVIRDYAHEFISRQDVQQLLDHVKTVHPKVVEELVPNQLTLGGVVRVLKNLLAEQISVRDLPTILERLADWAPITKDPEVLTEYVRQGMARTITQLFRSEDGTLYALTLGQGMETIFTEAIQRNEHEQFPVLDPDTAKHIMDTTVAVLGRFADINQRPVVLCSALVRPHFKKLSDRFIPNLFVLSYNEILPETKIQPIGTIEPENLKLENQEPTNAN